MPARLVLRNLKPLAEGKFRFTLRFYDSKGIIILDSSHWILNAKKKIQAPAANAHGKWFMHGDLNDTYEPYVRAALERAIDRVTNAIAKSSGLDKETTAQMWNSKEEHVIDLA